MPNRDGTGPQGQGPRTGGGWGPCTSATPEGPGMGGRMGRGGRGGGRGYRNQFHATGLTGWQRDALAEAGPQAPQIVSAEQLASVEDKLDRVLARLDDLEAKGSK